MYCRGYTDKAGKIFIRAFSIKMSSTFKNRQVRTFGGFVLRFSYLLFILTKPEGFLIWLAPRKCHLHSKIGKLGRLEGSDYVFHHFCITTTVLLSPNEDSDFFHNQ